MHYEGQEHGEASFCPSSGKELLSTYCVPRLSGLQGYNMEQKRHWLCFQGIYHLLGEGDVNQTMTKL